jgi:division/cell wall cluster transcriptional repressor MraZ
MSPVGVGLSGAFEGKLDDKSRSAIPAVLREAIEVVCAGSPLVAHMSLQGDCVHIRSLASWQGMVDKVKGLPQSQPEVLLFNRLVRGTTYTLETDKVGRVLFPAMLKEIAGIDSSVVFTGQDDHIEVWPKTAWQDNARTMRSVAPGMSVNFTKLGL